MNDLRARLCDAANAADNYWSVSPAPMLEAVRVLDAIDALHFPDIYGWCALCRDMYPCPTARLLNPEAQ